MRHTHTYSTADTDVIVTLDHDHGAVNAGIPHDHIPVDRASYINYTLRNSVGQYAPAADSDAGAPGVRRDQDVPDAGEPATYAEHHRRQLARAAEAHAGHLRTAEIVRSSTYRAFRHVDYLPREALRLAQLEYDAYIAAIPFLGSGVDGV